MKICHFAATKGIGRGEAFVEVANEMSEHITTHLLFPKGALFIGNISRAVNCHQYYNHGSRNNIFLLIEIYFYLRREKFDLITTHFAKATQIYLRLSKLLKTPHIAVKHNPRPSRIYNKVRNIIGVSLEASQSIKGKSSVVKTIRNGICAEDLNNCDITEQNQKFTILAVGRLDAIKGFDLLINALSLVEFDFRLVIAGTGPEEQRLKNLSIARGISKQVNFLGFRHDIKNLMTSSDIVVACSHSEGCPMVFIESLFYANLFISTPVGEAGNTLPSSLLMKKENIHEKICELYHNYPRYKNEFQIFANRSRQNYSVKKTVNEYLDFYREICANTS